MYLQLHGEYVQNVREGSNGQLPMAAAAAAFSCLAGSEKKHWWLSNRKIVDKHVKDARALLSTQEQNEVASALSLLDAALALSPRCEQALELKARSLLFLRRFKDVANMLQDYIPSLKMAADDSASTSSDSSSQQQVNLLGAPSEDSSLKCFSVADLKKKLMAGLWGTCEKEGQWRYLVLGQACCHLGLLEDAIALLQTWKRLNTAAFRRESICWSEDSFSLSSNSISNEIIITPNSPSSPLQPSQFEPEPINHLLGHIKFLLRRRAAALAALNAGLYSESIRHFSKIIDGRYGAPQGFLAQCYMNRAIAYRSDGRIAESIADCNRTLALNPTCILALETRAEMLELIRCLPDSLHDLEHLRLLYNTILRDRKLPGPAWRQHSVHYKEIPLKLSLLTSRIQELKQRIASGERWNVDYYSLIGLRRGCSRSELERAHRLLSLRHKPDKALNFLDKCEFTDYCDLDSIKDRAKMSSLLLYRLLQKGYTSLMSTIKDEEANEKQRKKAPPAPPKQVHKLEAATKSEPETNQVVLPVPVGEDKKDSLSKNSTSVHRGVFCRDLAVVGSLLSQVGYNRPLPVKYAGVSC